MHRIERGVHVIYNPDTDRWEVWELTPLEAFNLTCERFGVDVAIYNMNWSESNVDRNEHEGDPPERGQDT